LETTSLAGRDRMRRGGMGHVWLMDARRRLSVHSCMCGQCGPWFRLS